MIKQIGKTKFVFTALLSVLIVSCAFPKIGQAAADYSDRIQNISLMADPEEKYNHQYVKMAVSGSYIHIAWKAMSKDYSHNIIYYTRSSDGGFTFESPRQLVKDANQNDSEFKPEWNNFVADGAYVHLVYTIGWPCRIVYLRSVNNGESFYDPYILNAGGYYSYPGIHIAAEKGKLAVVWAVSSEYANLLCNYSDDGGTTFNFVQMAQAPSKSVSFAVHDLVRSGDYLYVLSSQYDGQYYHESRMYLWSSWNKGATFNPPVQVTVPTAEGKNYATKLQDVHYSPNLTADGKLVNMVWINNDNPGSFDGWWAPTLRTRRSADGGLTLEEPVTLHTFPAGYQSGANAGLETVTAQGSNLYITTVLSDKPAGTYVWRSSNSGINWSVGTVVSAGGWWPLIKTDLSDPSRIHLANSGYYLSSDSGETFNGGINPHYPFNDWQWEQFFVDDSGVGHLAAGSGSGVNSNDHEILYRRLGPEPDPGSADKSLTIINEGNTRRDNVQVPAAPDLNPTGAMTLEFWFRRESEAYNSQTFVELIAKKRLLSAYSSYALGLWDNFQIYCRLVTDKSANSSYGEWLGSGFVPPPGQWTHIAMTYDAGPAADNLKLYVNGLLHGTVSIQGNILTDTMDSQLLIGNRDQNAGSGSFSVDEVRLWNMPRSQAEIIADMGKQLVGNEIGLAAYYNCNDTVRDITGRKNDGFLMFRESFTPTGSKPPQVTALSPEPCGAGVSLSGTLIMTFNENILAEAGDITIRDMTESSAGTVFEVIPVKSSQVTVPGKTVTIIHLLDFSASRKYAVTMPSTCFKSSGGIYFQGISSNLAWTFATGEQGQPVLSASPEVRNVGASAGTTAFSVSNTGTGTMNWIARVISGDWLRITSGFSGTDAGTVNCAFDTNSNTSERRGIIRVTAAGAAGSPADLTVTQAKTVQTSFRPGPGMNDGTDDGSIDAGKDAEFYICRGEWSGTNTYISGVARSTCNDCNSKAYIQFNISTLPEDVWRVYLVVTHLPHTEHCYSMCAANFYFYPVLTPWDEMALPETPPEEGNPILGPIPISFPNDFGKREYDITGIYKQWKNGTIPNNGLVIYSPDTGCINAPAFWGVYSSDNSETDKRPYLKFALKGDMNGDGQLDLKDAILILQILAGIQPESSISLDMDVDGDGRIGIAEAICAMLLW